MGGGRWRMSTPVAEVSMTFLGTGTSVGVPVIGCDCEVCGSADPRNQRFRSSVVVRAGATTVLVDTGPDLRLQALREGLREIDAVLYTHAHLDHVAGFDELRAFCWRREQALPVFATAGCMAALEKMYTWAFTPEMRQPGYVWLEPQIITEPFQLGLLKVTPLPVHHGSVETIGFLFEYPGARSVAYISDVKIIPAATLARLQNIEVLVIDSLRDKPHPTHFSLADALATASACGAGETWLTHLTHDFDAATLPDRLPNHVHAAYDGLCLDLDRAAK
jgi:phosphoribosyl 1,2-cyclic phosphate phosphodiesterase